MSPASPWGADTIWHLFLDSLLAVPPVSLKSWTQDTAPNLTFWEIKLEGPRPGCVSLSLESMKGAKSLSFFFFLILLPRFTC